MSSLFLWQSARRAQNCIEVGGIQGAGPQILIWGAGSPKSPDHDDNSSPPLRIVSPPPINE